jgi:hypothetical protein
MKSLASLIFLMVFGIRAPCQWVDSGYKISMIPDGKVYLMGNIDPKTNWVTLRRDSLNVGDTVVFEAKTSGFPDTMKLIFSFAACGDRILGKTTIGDINASGKVTLVVPQISVFCIDNTQDFGTAKVKLNTQSIPARLVIYSAPLSVDEAYYNDPLNIASVEYFNMNGQKINPECHSGLMIVVSTLTNNKVKTSMVFRN